MSLCPCGRRELFHAEHGGNVGTVNVRIHQTHARAALGKCDGNIHRNRGLANSAFAGTDRDRVADRHVDQPAHATIIGNIRVQFDLNGLHTLNGHHRLPGFLFDLSAQRTGGCRQHDREGDDIVFDLQLADHVEGDKVLV